MAFSVAGGPTLSGYCPLGKPVATEATLTPEPSRASFAVGTIDGYTHTAATCGTSSIPGRGERALAHSDRTLSGESLPSSVVKSTIESARRRPASLAVVLIERVANEAARASVITRSTVGLERVGLERVAGIRTV